MRTTEQEWRARVDEQERSGLTVREFARQRGLNGNTLSWWRSKLRRNRAQETAMVPVEVVDGDPVGGPAQLELVHRSGVVLRLPRGFDASDLRRVLAVLEQRC